MASCQFPVNDEELKKRLTPEQYKVTRQQGTERAFTGKFYNFKGNGTYKCVVCGQPLFTSDTKFDSGTGWPSFFEALPSAVINKEDNSYGMRRVETVCSSCHSHLGHVFDDGPRDKTGLRYCMNSASLSFEESK